MSKRIKETIHPGNLVTDFMLPANNTETSAEISPNIQNIGLRIVDIFSGAEHTLPINMVKWLNMTDFF